MTGLAAGNCHGTGPGTRLVKDINSGSSSPFSLADDGTTYHRGFGELWKSDGHRRARCWSRIYEPRQSGAPVLASLTAWEGRCSSGPSTASAGTELWKSNGTSGGHRHGQGHTARRGQLQYRASSPRRSGTVFLSGQ